MTTPTQEDIRDAIAGNPDLQELIDDAAATTVIADRIPDRFSSDSCPNLSRQDVEDFNNSVESVKAAAAKVVTDGGGKKGGMRVQRGGPGRSRRRPASAPVQGQQEAQDAPSGEEDNSTTEESDLGDQIDPGDALASGVKLSFKVSENIVAARKKALEAVNKLKDGQLAQAERIQAQQDELMALLMPPDLGFDTDQEREQFLQHCEETRIAIRKAAAEPDKRFYWVLARMCHICAALAIGFTGVPRSLVNNFGEAFRGLISADSLGRSCDGDSIWNLFYFGDCTGVTTNAENMWLTVAAVIGAVAVTTGYVLITDTTNPFLVLWALGSRSCDSLAVFFENMGGVTNVIKWPFQKIAATCRYVVGAVRGTPAAVAAPAGQQVVFGPAPPPGPGGRKRRRTIKRRERKTKARKGKKGRKTKARKGKKRATRKRQRGGTCGKTSHQSTPMLDLYQGGGKKRKGKGRKMRKTHRKPKRRHGKKHGTRRR